MTRIPALSQEKALQMQYLWQLQEKCLAAIEQAY